MLTYPLVKLVVRPRITVLPGASSSSTSCLFSTTDNSANCASSFFKFRFILSQAILITFMLIQVRWALFTSCSEAYNSYSLFFRTFEEERSYWIRGFCIPRIVSDAKWTIKFCTFSYSRAPFDKNTKFYSSASPMASHAFATAPTKPSEVWFGPTYKHNAYCSIRTASFLMRNWVRSMLVT